jgi:hypothetical protein
MFLRLIIIFFGIFFLFGKSAWAGACDTTISSATTSQLSCADDDSLTVDSGGSITFDNQNAVLATKKNNITISNSGTIKATTDGGEIDSAIQGQSTLNLNITNSGTIWAQDDYGIKLIKAEKVTITNQAGGTIKATPSDSGSTIAVGGENMGNCDTSCKDASTTSTGIGLTLHNYGTIDASSRTVYGGRNSTHTSKKTKIYNYDGGMIDATDNSAVKFQFAEDFELYNYSGATIQADTGKWGVDLEGASTITIDNAGTISAGNSHALVCQSCSDLTLTNSGTISATTTSSLDINLVSGTNTITNSGTISSGGTKAINMANATGVTITNSGTISTDDQLAIDAENAFSPIITNSGSITAASASGIGINLGQDSDVSTNDGSGATITNSGTIEALGTNADGIRIGDGNGVYNDMTITNSGTIAGGDNSIWIDGSDTTGTNIITKEEATYTGEIEMESAVVTMTLDCSITKDMDIEIHGKTNMTVTNNLCGNDTYEILDSSKNADADNSETDGYLRIYGEDLDIAQDNAQYRSEIVLSKLRGILGPAINDRDLHVFHNTLRRSEYTDNISGAAGYFNSNSINPELSDYFIGYANQRVSFANSEYRGGENVALGMSKKFTANQFNYFITPLIGFEDLNITDVETEGNQAINTSLTSQFMGLDAGIGKAITVNERNRTSFKMHATYGAQRFPGYTASFTDGELLVDDSVDQVLGAGFEIRNSLGIERNLQLYVGGNWSETLSDELKITADGEIKNVLPKMQKALGHYAGMDVRAAIKGFSLDLNLEYGTTGGLTHQVASLSLVKSF